MFLLSAENFLLLVTVNFFFSWVRFIVERVLIERVPLHIMSRILTIFEALGRKLTSNSKSRFMLQLVWTGFIFGDELHRQLSKNLWHLCQKWYGFVSILSGTTGHDYNATSIYERVFVSRPFEACPKGSISRRFSLPCLWYRSGKEASKQP